MTINYLVICDDPMQAHELFNRCVAQCLDEHVTINRVSRCTFTIFTPDSTIRFVSKARAHEATRGFDGGILTGYELNDLLDRKNN